MFDRSFYIGGDRTNVKCEVHLNQPSTGFIQKSNPVSRFVRFQKGSEIESTMFPFNALRRPKLGDEEVIVLQVCIFGDDYFLAEYVLKKDLEDKK